MVKLIHRTDKAEKLIAYCARVSSPNQENPEISKLIAYCINNKHWSILEMASMCVEITTTRAISPQILRHRSFHFQEFSQRYAKATEFDFYEARMQDTKNRQNSTEANDEVEAWFLESQVKVVDLANSLYEEAISKGIAKECARILLPLSTETKLYMHGNLRDFSHYCLVRCDKATQKEHREIAEEIWKIFRKEFPIISEAIESQYEILKNV